VHVTNVRNFKSTVSYIDASRPHLSFQSVSVRAISSTQDVIMSTTEAVLLAELDSVVSTCLGLVGIYLAPLSDL
jgi:hypothetical protein